jgi:glutaminase
MNCESNSVLAATLANNGTCPITGEKILKQEAVTNVLSLMYSCGMSIYSGQFAFTVRIELKKERRKSQFKIQEAIQTNT